ncbi:class II fructose-bisphosphate aldolase [Lacticaseibacillus hegangensis]|uniref:Ketose-bisphosphate aldolase n=1 Tax=Lacticaseibacillus hegangensis TaxID=2486010 RepID=A0ABW4D0N8_9LACO|nr:class II fructose-bisphosphate aldolase [Lacticaseibacillus hegangensis]
MLVSSKSLLLQARKSHFAFPHFNFWDSNSIRAEIAAAEQLNLPVILAWAQKHSPELNIYDALALGKYFGSKASVPVVLHLDHGTDPELVKYGVSNGFTSVMIDASDKPLAENINITKDVVAFAHQRGVVVEAEVGHVGTNSTTDNSMYTELNVAKQFQDQTLCDSMAVSIGTSHGVYKTKTPPKLNFQRLEEIREATSIPLVLHGGSSSGDDNLTRCAEEGIAKVNIYTDLANMALNASQAKQFDSEADMAAYQRQQVKELALHYYSVFETAKYRYEV